MASVLSVIQNMAIAQILDVCPIVIFSAAAYAEYKQSNTGAYDRLLSNIDRNKSEELSISVLMGKNEYVGNVG